MTATIGMAPSRLAFILCSIVICLIALSFAQEEPFTICLNSNFTSNSTYQANLNHLLSSFSSHTEFDYGFYNASYGQKHDRVNALALCRGDVKPDSCQSCVQNLSLALTESCPNKKEAFVWQDDCMLRYSNRSFFGNMEFGPSFSMYNLNNVSELNQFRAALGNLSDNLIKQAASGGPLFKFATGNTTTPSSQSIYALVQCTPDLSEQECIDCLNNATKLLPQCCDGRQGGRVIAPSCSFRYEKNIFYDTTAYAATPSSSPSPSPSTQSFPPDQSPPSASPSSPPTHQSPAPQQDQQSLPPSPTNSATQRGKESNLSRTAVLIAVPLLILQYLSSVLEFF